MIKIVFSIPWQQIQLAHRTFRPRVYRTHSKQIAVLSNYHSLLDNTFTQSLYYWSVLILFKVKTLYINSVRTCIRFVYPRSEFFWSELSHFCRAVLMQHVQIVFFFYNKLQSIPRLHIVASDLESSEHNMRAVGSWRFFFWTTIKRLVVLRERWEYAENSWIKNTLFSEHPVFKWF